jgi:hypothetical protein
MTSHHRSRDNYEFQSNIYSSLTRRLLEHLSITHLLSLNRLIPSDKRIERLLVLCDVCSGEGVGIVIRRVSHFKWNLGSSKDKVSGNGVVVVFSENAERSERTGWLYDGTYYLRADSRRWKKPPTKLEDIKVIFNSSLYL